jgi:aldose 1-epimerase
VIGAEIVRVESDAISAELLPAIGARLHRLRAFGHDLLRTPEDPATHASDPFFWGAYVLAPWANRLHAGPMRAAGRPVDLPANFSDGSAIHGQVYDRAWHHDGGRFTIAAGGDGWPWRYEVEARGAAEARTLRLAYTLLNRSDAPMPAGLGLHPWWRQPVEVAIAGRSVYPTTTDSPPMPESVAGRFDRRALEPMPHGIDAAWTDLDDPAVELRWPDAGVGLTMRAATTPELHVVVASPPDVDAVAVEVQTHAPQGLRRLEHDEPGALAVIAPGSALSLTIELVARRVP